MIVCFGVWALASCKTIQPIAPSLKEIKPPPISQPVSTINIPISVDLNPFFKIAEDSMPKEFSGEEHLNNAKSTVPNKRMNLIYKENILYRVYIHMLNQTDYNRLNLDQFSVKDPVIIKIKGNDEDYAYYGILFEINTDTISIVGNHLAWVLVGDLKLEQHTFKTNSIDYIKLYTLEAVEVSRDLEMTLKYHIYYKPEIKDVYRSIRYLSFEHFREPMYDYEKQFKYVKEFRELRNKRKT